MSADSLNDPHFAVADLPCRENGRYLDDASPGKVQPSDELGNAAEAGICDACIF